MTKWKDKQYWYFVTTKDMGETMSLNPRTPLYKNDDEPDCKRICVAPTAAHCMSAINLDSHDHRVYVYRTRRQVKAREPYNVYDSHITNEHWLHTRTRFKLVDTLDIQKRKRSWGYLSYSESEQRKNLEAIRSFCRRKSNKLSIQKHANTP